jgi:hypothetical protein
MSYRPDVGSAYVEYVEYEEPPPFEAIGAREIKESSPGG